LQIATVEINLGELRFLPGNRYLQVLQCFVMVVLADQHATDQLIADSTH
jgi:hypothetical protein